jgi:hypothetical protein
MVAVDGEGQAEPILWKPEAVQEANAAHAARKSRQAGRKIPG